MYNHLCFLEKLEKEIRERVVMDCKEQKAQLTPTRINELVKFHIEQLANRLVDQYITGNI